MAVHRRKTRAVVSALWLTCCGVSSFAEAQGLPQDKIDGLPAFLDTTIPQLMAQGHVVGAAVAVVHEGRVIVLRGYGASRLDTGSRVDPARTLFRLGSVTKPLTALAAMQLVDAGKLDLHRDVQAYLPDIPLRYGATMHQLLTHTAGLDERFAGAYTDAPEHIQTLSDHLRRNPPEQVMLPGSAYSYSNYNYALAGLVIERLSGLTYEAYMADLILKPLKMTASTAHQPPEAHLALALARGYHWVGGVQRAIPYRFTQVGPSGGISATAADMGRFMLALLGDGSVDGKRVLSPESLKQMLAPQYTPDPRIPATAYGFLHWVTHGRRLLHKDGTLGDQVSVVMLDPAARFGIFVGSNAVPGIANHVLEPLLTYLVGPAPPTPPATPLPDAPRRAPRFAGIYRDYHHTRNDMSRLRELMPMIQSPVVADEDGAIRWQGRRWLEVEPSVFRSADSEDVIVFREDTRGRITELHAWGATYERVVWWQQARFQVGALASCVLAFLAYPLFRGRHAHRRRDASAKEQLARNCATFVALANLIFVGGLAVFFRDLGSTTPLPLPVVLWLSLPLASVAVTAVLPACVAWAWQEKWWTRGERLGYSTFVVLAVVFMVFLDYWRLLGVRY